MLCFDGLSSLRYSPSQLVARPPLSSTARCLFRWRRSMPCLWWTLCSTADSTTPGTLMFQEAWSRGGDSVSLSHPCAALASSTHSQRRTSFECRRHLFCSLGLVVFRRHDSIQPMDRRPAGIRHVKHAHTTVGTEFDISSVVSLVRPQCPRA